mmetsp:Transcript_3532/g.13510  ORF Transcript_3532/g.13510 Transcript_3532/m.13510 type:complete len:310 (-) Transcript_3532:30-959(-)
MNSTRERFKTAEQGIREEKVMRKWEKLESGRGISSDTFDVVAQHERSQKKRQENQKKQQQIEKYGMNVPNPRHIRSVRGAESIRHKIIQNIAAKLHLIQNAAHGESKLRDLNDSINDLLKEKEKYEQRIVDLNGPDYRKEEEKSIPMEERDTITVDGYHYFGAAKLLPGVRELFEKKNFVFKPKTSIEEYKDLDGEYYGMGNDEHLVQLEAPRERQWEHELDESLRESFERNQKVHVARRKHRQPAETANNESSTNIFDYPMPDFSDPFAILNVDHTHLPSIDDMNKAILEARKQQIMKRYQQKDPAER